MRQGQDVLLTVDVRGRNDPAKAQEDSELRDALISVFLTLGEFCRSAFEKRHRFAGDDQETAGGRPTRDYTLEALPDYLLLSESIEEDLRRMLSIEG